MTSSGELRVLGRRRTHWGNSFTVRSVKYSGMHPIPRQALKDESLLLFTCFTFACFASFASTSFASNTARIVMRKRHMKCWLVMFFWLKHVCEKVEKDINKDRERKRKERKLYKERQEQENKGKKGGKGWKWQRLGGKRNVRMKEMRKISEGKNC